VGDLKKLIAAQTGTDWKKIQLKKWFQLAWSAFVLCLSLMLKTLSRYSSFKHHITPEDYDES
jgi:hypothetical protein